MNHDLDTVAAALATVRTSELADRLEQLLPRHRFPASTDRVLRAAIVKVLLGRCPPIAEAIVRAADTPAPAIDELDRAIVDLARRSARP